MVTTMANMKLYALTDFPDDCIQVTYTPEMLDKLIGKFAECGFSRMYFQYYGNREDEYFWTNKSGRWCGNRTTAEVMPNMSRVYVDVCKRHGMEAACVMRPLEQGNWIFTSPYSAEVASDVAVLGGHIVNPSAFLRKNQDLRIKRRSYDLDPNAVNKTIASIKLYKQNNIPTRIQKENITIYTSPNNAYYKPYEKDFSFSITEETAAGDVDQALFTGVYTSKRLCAKGDPISVITLSGLEITDQFVVIGVKCEGECKDGQRFINTPVNGIACFEANGAKICATPGGDKLPPFSWGAHLEQGFNFDDGFGVHQPVVLDPDEKEGFIAIAKSKNQYNPGALCECEPKVQEYWMSMLNKAMDDGYDIVGNRIECHSIQTDEPYAYGYNDAVKELYFAKYGVCEEQDMDLEKIAAIRGNVFSELFANGAAQVRKRGKKVYVTLNIEMLYDPIPLDRLGAYPMTVQWQWERWLQEVKPDEINFRMYQSTPKFLLSDPQCLRMLEVAKSYNVPMTVERYVSNSIPDEYKLLNETGLFDALILYETAELFRATPEGEIVPLKKSYIDTEYVLTELQKLRGEKNEK